MGEEVTLRLLAALIFIAIAWKLTATLRASRRARKAYEHLSEREKRDLERNVFQQDAWAAAYAKPLSTKTVVLIIGPGIVLAGAALYLIHHFTGR